MNNRLYTIVAVLLVVAPTCCGLLAVGAAVAYSARPISPVLTPWVAIELPDVAVVCQAVRSSLLHTLYQIIEFLKALGICIGSALLLFLCFSIFSASSAELEQRLRRQSKDYSVRCYATKMKKPGYGPIPDDLPEESPQETYGPVLTNIAITNYGIWFREESKRDSHVMIAADTLNRPDDLSVCWEDTIIPTSGINLHYTISRREGNQRSEYGPFKSADFADAVPRPLRDDLLTIVIIFACVIKKSDLQNVIYLEQPIKLEINVLDKLGHDDQTAAAGLYKAIRESMESSTVDDDDSWMYHSRPMSLW